MRYQELIAHKGFADAALLNAVRQHPAAASDAQLRALLHHVLVSNRFWLLTIVGEPFVVEPEMQIPETFEALSLRFRETHERETAWLAGAADSELSRTLEHAFIPGGRCTIADGQLQVCLHSQGHRGQCAKMLRALGGSPPATDFIAWRVERRPPAWPV